jgi:hypothetical protein
MTTTTIYAHAIEQHTSPRAAQIIDEALRSPTPPGDSPLMGVAR